MKSSNPSNKSERQVERKQEDSEFQPVIIKRIDQARRHPDDILESAVEEGVMQYHRTKYSLLLSAIAGGLVMGITVLSVAFGYALGEELSNPLLQRVLQALFYPIGFIICILGGSQLFTEQTATALYPALDRKCSVVSFFLVLFVVLTGNLLGAASIAYVMTSVSLEPTMAQAFVHIGEEFFNATTGHLLWSSILAGWLMALGGWMVVALPNSTSQLICIYLVTFVIGIGKFHHSIAGAGEVFAYMFVKESPEFWLGVRSILWAVVGNVIGGSVFVALLNYGHIREYNQNSD